jgi:hypothetical protein
MIIGYDLSTGFYRARAPRRTSFLASTCSTRLRLKKGPEVSRGCGPRVSASLVELQCWGPVSFSSLGMEGTVDT